MKTFGEHKPDQHPITHETGTLRGRGCVVMTSADGRRFAEYASPEEIAHRKGTVGNDGMRLSGENVPTAVYRIPFHELDAIKLDGFKQIKTA